MHLRLHPKVGDTLYTWLEQQTEVSASMPGNALAALKPVTTSVAIHSRTIVRATQQASTTVLTIVESASLASTDTHAAAQVAEAQRSLEGQQLLLVLGADGTVESARDVHGAAVPRDVAEAMAAMPAIFPRNPVAVGDHWTRETPLPSGGPLAPGGSAHARAVFHLDSLQRGMAYVSMHGDIAPDSSNLRGELSGSITGTMQVDRVRGWMTDSWFLVILHSTARSDGSARLAPMRFVTRVTQRLRTMDKR